MQTDPFAVAVAAAQQWLQDRMWVGPGGEGQWEENGNRKRGWRVVASAKKPGQAGRTTAPLSGAPPAAPPLETAWPGALMSGGLCVWDGSPFFRRSSGWASCWDPGPEPRSLPPPWLGAVPPYQEASWGTGRGHCICCEHACWTNSSTAVGVCKGRAAVAGPVGHGQGLLSALGARGVCLGNTEAGVVYLTPGRLRTKASSALPYLPVGMYPQLHSPMEPVS